MWKSSSRKWAMDFYTHEQLPRKGRMVLSSQWYTALKCLVEKQPAYLNGMKITDPKNWPAADSGQVPLVAAHWQQYLISSPLHFWVFSICLWKCQEFFFFCKLFFPISLFITITMRVSQGSGLPGHPFSLMPVTIVGSIRDSWMKTLLKLHTVRFHDF